MNEEPETVRPWSKDLPSLTGVVVGGTMFVTGVMLILTIIGAPLGILLYGLGLGWMLTPKDRSGR